MAQSTNTLVAEGLALPKDHQYEQYNAAAGSYGKVDVSKVPALVKQKQPIYDRTAKAWVYQSRAGSESQVRGRDRRSAAAAAPAASGATRRRTCARRTGCLAPAATPAATPAPAAAAPAPRRQRRLRRSALRRVLRPPRRWSPTA